MRRVAETDERTIHALCCASCSAAPLLIGTGAAIDLSQHDGVAESVAVAEVGERRAAVVAAGALAAGTRTGCVGGACRGAVRPVARLRLHHA